MMKTTKKMGRPRVENKQKHARLAVYPETHAIFKRLSDAKGVHMTEFLAILARKLNK